MGIARSLGALNPAFQIGVVARRAHAGQYGAARRSSRRTFQAAFRTSTGSIWLASRYSTRNGKSIGPSPGLPGGRDCEKVRRRPRTDETQKLFSRCAQRSSANSLGPGQRVRAEKESEGV